MTQNEFEKITGMQVPCDAFASIGAAQPSCAEQNLA